MLDNIMENVCLRGIANDLWEIFHIEIHRSVKNIPYESSITLWLLDILYSDFTLPSWRLI